jgi:hypothetical protein
LRFDDREVKKDIINVLREIEGWIVDYVEKNLGKLAGRTHP